MTLISLVRHGLVDNPGQVYYGRLPGFALAAEGRRQAAATGDYLSGQPIAAVYHSPMLRAFETAEIVRRHCAATAPLVECDLLNEIHSPFDGLPATEMEKIDWNFYRDVVPPYETPEDIVERMVRFFEKARREHGDEHVVAVSHADPIAFAILWAGGRPLAADHRKRLTECGIPADYPAPASVTTFSFDDSHLAGFRYHSPGQVE